MGFFEVGLGGGEFGKQFINAVKPRLGDSIRSIGPRLRLPHAGEEGKERAANQAKPRRVHASVQRKPTGLFHLVKIMNRPEQLVAHVRHCASPPFMSSMHSTQRRGGVLGALGRKRTAVPQAQQVPFTSSVKSAGVLSQRTQTR